MQNITCRYFILFTRYQNYNADDFSDEPDFIILYYV